MQVALYLHRFGTSHRTDGFIVAFAIYSLVVVVAQILRTTAVPLVSGTQAPVTRTQFGWAVAAVAVLTTALFAGLAVPLGRLLTSSTGSQARSIATSSLLVMAPAMGLQMAGAGLAVIGGLRERLVVVALGYMASSGVGLVAFVALAGPAAERVLAYTMLISSATVVVVLLLGVRPQLAPPPPRAEIARAAALVLRTAPIPASFVLMYPITLALVPHVRVGTVTIFGLAFTACSYLAGATGQALSMVRVFAFTALEHGADDERRDLVSRAFRYSMLVATPGLGAGILAGEPIVRALLASRTHGGRGFATDLLLLIPWLVATLGLWATLPAVLARTRGHRLGQTTAIVTVLLCVHIGAAFIGRAVGGFHGLILMLAAAPALFTITSAVRLGARVSRHLARDGALIVALAGIAFAAALPVRGAIGGGAGAGVAAALLGFATYGVLAALAFPSMARAALSLFRR